MTLIPNTLVYGALLAGQVSALPSTPQPKLGIFLPDAYLYMRIGANWTGECKNEPFTSDNCSIRTYRSNYDRPFGGVAKAPPHIIKKLMHSLQLSSTEPAKATSALPPG